MPSAEIEQLPQVDIGAFEAAAPITTTTSLVSSADPSILGQNVTFTATVTNASGTGGTPTGSAEFFIDGASVGSVVLNSSGTATYSTAALSAGTHTISTVYAAHGAFLASSSASLAQTILTRGQKFTFDQEGGIYLRPYAIEGYPQSGVTIGVGYDFGQRTKEVNFTNLTKASIDPTTANALAGAWNKKGENAEKFVQSNPGLAITTEQAISLFLNIYKEMETTTARIFGATDWDNLNQAIKDILVDMTYRGDLTRKVVVKVWAYVVSNDLAGFTTAMSDKKLFPNLTLERFNARLDYLRHS